MWIRYGLILFCAIGMALQAGSVPPPEPGTGSVSGTVRLVPWTGLRSPKDAADPSRDPSDVKIADYDGPSFIVVYLQGLPPPIDDVTLTLTTELSRPRIEPAYAAVGRGGTVALKNGTDASHLVSCPDLEVLQPLAPGEELTLVTDKPGPLEIHVLAGGADAGTTVFVAPGPYDVVSNQGSFRLAGLAPGAAKLWTWHPRLPADTRDVTIAADRGEHVDLEIQVRRLDKLEF